MASLTNNAIADTKETCLVWRTSRLTGKKYAYFRKRIGKKVKWQSLGELTPDDARANVRKLRRIADLGEFEQRFGFSTHKPAASTVGDLFKAYRKFSEDIIIDQGTVENYMLCMSIILRRVKGEDCEVEKVSLNEFTTSLLREFAAKTVQIRKKKYDEKIAEGKMTEEEKQKKLESTQRTIKSTVQQARALFSREARSSKGYDSLTLPDLTDVMNMTIGSSTIVAYDPPDQEVLDKIAKALSTLKKEHPEMWLAFNLEVNGGLRRSSARAAKWEWFKIIGKNPLTVDLHVEIAKGNKSTLRFDSNLYTEMSTMKGEEGGSTYILPGKDDAERDLICEKLAVWLRKIGLNKRMPNHELRKLYGDQKYIHHGAEEAQRALGHSDPKLTSTVYSSSRARKALRVF